MKTTDTRATDGPLVIVNGVIGVVPLIDGVDEPFADYAERLIRSLDPYIEAARLRRAKTSTVH